MAIFLHLETLPILNGPGSSSPISRASDQKIRSNDVWAIIASRPGFKWNVNQWVHTFAMPCKGAHTCRVFFALRDGISIKDPCFSSCVIRRWVNVIPNTNNSTNRADFSNLCGAITTNGCYILLNPCHVTLVNKFAFTSCHVPFPYSAIGRSCHDVYEVHRHTTNVAWVTPDHRLA